MIVDDHHAYERGPGSAAERESRRPPGEPGMPLGELGWSDSLVGMGFPPHKPALPTNRRWGSAR